MAEELGNIRGSIILDVKQALDAYTKVRQDHLSTVSTLNQGAGALTALGAGFTAAGVGMAAGIWVAVDAASEFERKLDYFSAVSGATQDEYEAIRQKALQLGTDTIYSADQIADSFVELSKSGVTTKEVLDGIGEAVANLGAATDMPLADAAKGLTTILNTFGLEAEDAVGVVDRLAGAANSSAIDVNDLILTMTYAGASAKTAGISFEDINTAIALLGERGIKGSKAGTGLRQVIDKLIAPTKAGSSALQELGLNAEDGSSKLRNMDGTLKPLPQLLDLLNGSLDGMTQDKKIDILGQIFPITSLPTVLNLLDGGSEGLARLNAEISKTTAMDIASERLDNLSGDLEILRGNFDTLLINIGATQQALVRGLVQAITTVIDWLNSLSPEMLGLITNLALVGAGVLILFGVFALFAAAMVQIVSFIIILKDAFLFLAAPLKSMVAQFRTAWALFAGSPIGLVVGLLLALAAALIYVFTQTAEGQAAWSQIMATFRDAFTSLQPLIGQLGEAFGRLLGVVVPALSQIASVLIEVFLQAVIALLPVIQVLVEVIAGALVIALNILLPILIFIADVLSGPFGQVLGVIAGIILGIVIAIQIWTAAQWLLNIALNANPISLIIMAIAALVAAIIWVATQTTFFQDAWAAVSAFFIALWTNVSSFFITVWTAISSFFIDLWTNISSFVTTVVTAIATFFITVFTSIATFFIAIWTGIVAFFTPIITLIGNVIRFFVEATINIFLIFAAVLVTIWTGISTVISTVWNAIVAFLTPIITGIVNFFITTFTALSDFWNGVWAAISTFVIDVWNNIMAFILPIVLNIASFIIDTVTNIQNTWNAIWGAISSFFTDLWNTILGFITGVISNLVNAIQGPVRQIQSFWNSTWSAISSFLSDVWNNIVNAVTGAVGNLLSVIGGIQGQVMGFFSGIGSWLFNTGQQLIMGLVNGIKGMVSRVISAIGDVVNGAINWAKGVLGIASPSRVFRGIGKDTIMGMIVGMENTRPVLEQQMAMVGDSIDAFYDQVYAAREYDTMLNLQANMSTRAYNSAMENQLAVLNDNLEEIAAKDTIYVEKIENNNPLPETAGDSLPTGIRKAVYLVGGG